MALVLTTFILFVAFSCAKSVIEIKSRIISGITAYDGQFPWHVVLKHVFLKDLKQVTCGASLISREWVLTAAHCVNFWPWIYLEFGTADLYKRDVQSVISTTLYRHSSFKANPPEYDIAVIRLPQPVFLNDFVQPISLPTRDWLNFSLIGHTTIVIGFGKTEDNGQDDGESATELNFAPMTIIGNDDCSKYFEHALIDSVFCGKGYRSNEGACIYDSGGSLISRDSLGNYVLVGIVSYRSDLSCEIPGLPTVFTKVVNFLDWIQYVTQIQIG